MLDIVNALYKRQISSSISTQLKKTLGAKKTCKNILYVDRLQVSSAKYFA